VVPGVVAVGALVAGVGEAGWAVGDPAEVKAVSSTAVASRPAPVH
jgi:hypothetical protein